MRIHTSLRGHQIYDAARYAHVSLERCDQTGSRTRARKFDVILSGSSGRHMNSGQYGSLDIGDGYAATWDEWGLFLAYIFELDPIMHCWAYMGAQDFEWQTGGRYNNLTWDEQCKNHKWGFVTVGERACEKGCGAVRRWPEYNKRPVAVRGGFAAKGSATPPRGVPAAEAFLATT